MKTFPTPPRLENERVLMLPLGREHFQALKEIAQDPSLWVDAYLEEALREQEKNISIPFVIIDKRTNKTAGSTRYHALFPDHKRLEIGWTWIGKSFQQTGLNRAMKFEMLRYGFETLDLNRIELKTDMINMVSRHAMQKMGATQEGIFRSHMVTEEGRLRDTVYFSIIREEWPLLRETVFKVFYEKSV
jgi:RimJ/RimL family protein N-acetyltransferase